MEHIFENYLKIVQLFRGFSDTFIHLLLPFSHLCLQGSISQSPTPAHCTSSSILR